MKTFQPFRVLLVHVLILMLSVSQASQDNWFVLVAASRYWFNYRHLSNILVLYDMAKRMGVRDDRIIVMNGLDDVCGVRNKFPGQIFDDLSLSNDLCRSDLEIDYHGSDVTVDNFLRLLTGRHSPYTPLSKQMNSNNNSNIVVFLSGHGGDEFFKFRDREELSSDELGVAVADMSDKSRFRNLVFIADTCQGATLFSKINVPRNVISISSSQKGQNSFSYLPNEVLGATTIDRFSYKMAEFFKMKIRTPSDLKKYSFKDVLKSMDPNFLQSRPSISVNSANKSIENLPLSTFFSTLSKETELMSIFLEDNSELESFAMDPAGREFSLNEHTALSSSNLKLRICSDEYFAPSKKDDYVEIIYRVVNLVHVAFDQIQASMISKLPKFWLFCGILIIAGILKKPV